MNGPSAGDRGSGYDTVGGTARLMFYSLLAISLMALDYRGHYVERVQAIASHLVEPLFWAVDLPFSGAQSIGLIWRNRVESERQMDELQLDLARARARLGRLDDLESENEQLRAILSAARRIDQEFIAAELSSVDLDPFAHRIMVRRGRADGIEPGMPVVDARGVLGQVDQVLTKMSRIILVSDPDHALPVQVLPGGERTIAYGSGSLDRLRLTDLPMNASVNPDDLIVTSGIGGRFPAGLPVARVESVQRLPGQAFATAYAVPLSAMDRNRLVLILRAVPVPEAAPPAEPDTDPETNPEPTEETPPANGNGNGADAVADPSQTERTEAQ